MPRKGSSMKKMCCVCLGITLKLSRLSVNPENQISFQEKLKACIPEIEWLSSFYICEDCIKLLDIAYVFRETCFHSDLRRRKIKDEDVDLKILKTDFLVEDDEDALLQVYRPELEVELPPDSGLEHKSAIKEEATDDDTCENLSDTGDESDDSCKPLQKVKKKSEYEPQKKRKRKKLEFICEVCNKVYNSSIKLVSHCISDHKMKKLDVRPFGCDRCPSRFCNSSNLLQHVKYHDAVRSNMCTFCGKGFITKTDLTTHEKVHLNKREYRCDECGKCFNTHKDVRSHKLVVHTDQTTWKYRCDICEKPFPIKSNYDSHMRRHTGERKFECHLCQRKFIDKCVMQRHMRTHSNVREYKCSHCDKEYKDPGVLKVHMAKSHGIGVGQVKIPNHEKKYICHICPKSYYAKNKLTRHLYTHTGEKPFDCPICGKKFNDKSYVKQHLKKAHNMDQMPPENKTDVHGLEKEEILQMKIVNISVQNF
ncbi:zinc finger imprinted 3-like [Anthonomus grandis grandis]|uniref:zinc finger imprinted 3-like n=1 Tax=Anthonomus grandis grandis TaxID=2921223 RepID=UPI002166A0BD|nr:zinc finger imprinted 3-like [Anthonomus grandis grandis]